MREALARMQARLAKERRVESAKIYAQIYAQDEELRKLTDAAVEDWP